MPFEIDCLRNKTPYSKQIEAIKKIFDQKKYNDDLNLKCQLVINLYNIYLSAINNPENSLEIFKSKLEKIIFKINNIKNKNKNKHKHKNKHKNKIQKDHYFKLFSKFNDTNIFKNPEIFLRKRFERNKINMKNYSTMSAIDLGCGIGRYTIALKKFGFKKVLGIDINSNNIKMAKKIVKTKKIKNINFACRNILKLKYKKKFDFAFSYGSFHHTKSIDKCINIMKRLLKPKSEGLLYLSHKGGLRWAVVQLSRYLLRNEDHNKIYKYFYRKIKDTKKIYLILDHILVPINTLTSPNDIKNFFQKNKIKNYKRLCRGSDSDDIEKIHKFKKKISKKNLFYIFGYGENRYYFKINERK